MRVSFHVDGIDALDSSLDVVKQLVSDATKKAITFSAHEVEAKSKDNFGPAHARGTPKTVQSKPQSITGSLRRSIRVRETVEQMPNTWVSRIAPDMIYGRRVELGFVGADSLGRVYNQPPYPYLGPGLIQSIPVFDRLTINSWSGAIHS